jgi:hypothetical protein
MVLRKDREAEGGRDIDEGREVDRGALIMGRDRPMLEREGADRPNDDREGAERLMRGAERPAPPPPRNDAPRPLPPPPLERDCAQASVAPQIRSAATIAITVEVQARFDRAADIVILPSSLTGSPSVR